MKIPDDLKWKDTGKTCGAGGQAQIRIVKNMEEQNGPEYAMKILKNIGSKQAYERFYREIKAIKEINHPNIIKIIDYSELDADFHFYVMEYNEDTKTLQKVIESNKNPFYCNPVVSLYLFLDICYALSACNNCSSTIFHRDLKPSNILILPDNSIKIIDFGICFIDGETRITLVDEGVGSVNYMAPECESGSTGKIVAGTDLYSAGKILWAAITGKSAFARENPVFNDKSMNDMFPESPSTWHLYHIFEKTIRRDWKNRWVSAAEAINATQFVISLVENGFPPLENIKSHCPICGVGKMDDFDGSHMVFGNPMLKGIAAGQCSYCGVCLAINLEKRNKSLDNRKSLE